MFDDKLIEKTLESTKTIAMIGVSTIRKEVSSNIKRRPSTIVMKYMQDFGYKVIPVNPFSAGETIHGETVVAKLSDIKIPIDIVDVFRPSIETPKIANGSSKNLSDIYNQPILPVIKKEAIIVSNIRFIWVTEEPTITGSISLFIFFIPEWYKFKFHFGSKPIFISG